MKMVKSLLLGSAAGLVAVTAGQAADLPVKAKPVEYVKICSLYGAGFYYMPGTDLCIKVGGWVRAEAEWGGNNSMTWGPFNANPGTRNGNNYGERARGYITADVRNQTEYGTVRGYLAVGVNTSDFGTSIGNGSATSAFAFSSNRAFVQWAGMTAGLSQSFYDFYSVPAVAYRGGYLPASDTGDGGWWVWAYTAQFGGGFSGTISAETRRMTQIINAGELSGSTTTSGSVAPGSYPATLAVGGAPAAGATLFGGFGAYGGSQAPDVVANLRLDQAWGGAQLMGALHEVNANYYGASPITGHPSDSFGWAVGAGLKINTPFITQGDWFQAQANYTQGALRYLFNTPNTNWGKVDGNSQAWGVLSDCVFGGVVAAGTATGCNMTTAWGFNASFEHFWTPSFHTSVYGAWYQVQYDSQANNMLCSIEGGAIASSLTGPTAGCNNNWSTWGVGARTQWDVTKTFYLGVEVLYSNLHSATENAAGIVTSTIAGTANISGVALQENNSSNWMVSVRAHRDFLP